MSHIPVRFIAAAAAAAALTGACTGGSTAAITSEADAASPGVLGRVLVAGRLAAGMARMRSFPVHLAAGLRSCGIEPDTVVGWGDPALALEGDAVSRGVAERRAAGRVAVLEMDGFDSDVEPGLLRWTYALRLRAADGATTWRARFDFTPHFGWGHNDPGADLARMVVGRMATDGVLRSCPAGNRT